MRIIGNRGNTARKVQAVASGALASGDTVVVNADGTVSVVTGAAGGSGTPVVFESATTTFIAATFDSNLNKVVIAYTDTGNSSYGTAVVGTVNGSTISFGTAVVFENATTTAYLAATFDSNSNKVVITYYIANGASKAVVGTVSGTDISFGSPVVFDSAAGPWASATFDSNSNKVVISYARLANSYYGTAIVGTVSGTSISFGTPVVFNSARVDNTSIVFDSNSNKVVIAYQDRGNSYRGASIVGTVSGTGISFGSEVVFETGGFVVPRIVFDSNSNKVVIVYGISSNVGKAIVGTVSGTAVSYGTSVIFDSGANSSAHALAAAFDSTQNKVVVSYIDTGNSNYGTNIVGTVSGTSISFDDKSVFESAEPEYISATFDSNSNKVVTAYQDKGGSNHGTSSVYTVGSTNLTSENFIGIASNGYATGQAATINAKGFIDDNQSSLTAGQSYFVQTNGDLGLTAADPSVFAGTAVSATKLIVKG